MIAAFSGIKIHLCTQPTDMRRGFDGLSGMVTTLLQQDPLSGLSLIHISEPTRPY